MFLFFNLEKDRYTKSYREIDFRDFSFLEESAVLGTKNVIRTMTAWKKSSAPLRSCTGFVEKWTYLGYIFPARIYNYKILKSCVWDVIG